ncbi:MAG: hypothetical protein Q9M39_01505 [Sulfurovum sp.]|nr:hypothetical protein [Sulfurovum sp.]
MISADILRWLKEQKSSLEKTEQFYIKSANNIECYYLRTFPNIYTKVTMGKEDDEYVGVTQKEYLSQRENHRGKKILKQSYSVVVDDEIFVVSKYLKKRKGLYILLAYFKDAKSMRESYTLETLQPFILKEIDHDEKYNDKALSIYVKPREYDLNKLFDKIDAFESANLFFWQVPRRLYIRDGVALLLYKNLRLLHYYKVNYQRKHLSATLHRLRVLMRRIATILDTFSEFFTPGVQNFAKALLLRYYEETKLLRTLYFLEELSATRKNAKLSLHSELKTLTSEEEKEVTQMLLSQPFGHLIQILTRELYDQQHQQYRSLSKEVKKIVRNKLHQLEALLAQTKEGYDEEMLEEFYTFMDSLQTLLEDFYHIIGEKETQRLIEELNILFKPLREYRNCKERAIILTYIKEQADNTRLDTNPLLCEKEVELKEKIAYALKLLRTSRFYV